MKLLFLFPYPLNESASQRFRFEQYFIVLQGNGFSIDTQSFWSEAAWKILYQPGKIWLKLIHFVAGYGRRFLLLLRVHTCSFVFIHRECTPVGPPVFEWVIAKLFRKKIIYDFDDAIWLPNTSIENKFVAAFKCHGKVKFICRWSYKVSCGNHYLADYAKEFNTHTIVNPTTVDTEKLHNPVGYPSATDPAHVAIGWTGSHSTLNYLTPLLPIIDSLSKRYPQLRLLVIADKNPGFFLECLQFIQWSKENEIGDLMKIDIGIMPLTDNEWGKGKCGFKAIQYMSLKKPALVSPVGVNSEIVDHGTNGFVCKTLEDWSNFLDYLILRPDECLAMGEKGREKVIRSYSVTSNASTFLALFE